MPERSVTDVRMTPPTRGQQAAVTPAEVSDFARSVHRHDDPQRRLQRGVDLVVGLVEGCDHVGVTVAEGSRLLTPACSDDVVRRGDALQQELGEGPCLDSVRLEHTVISTDLAREQRWPRWSARAREELGVRSMLAVLLFTDRDTWGALNFYGDRPEAWTDDDIDTAHALAGHLAVAVADAHEIAHRGRAMLNRTVIGQAEGILMERYGLDADQAFAYLRRISQGRHVKLADVAADLVATRRVPHLEHGPGEGR